MRQATHRGVNCHVWDTSYKSRARAGTIRLTVRSIECAKSGGDRSYSTATARARNTAVHCLQRRPRRGSMCTQRRQCSRCRPVPAVAPRSKRDKGKDTFLPGSADRRASSAQPRGAAANQRRPLEPKSDARGRPVRRRCGRRSADGSAQRSCPMALRHSGAFTNGGTRERRASPAGIAGNARTAATLDPDVRGCVRLVRLCVFVCVCARARACVCCSWCCCWRSADALHLF